MLQLSVINRQQNQHFDHSDGPLEFGRGPRRDESPARRILVKDSYVSRDQLAIEERDGGQLYMQNLSQRRKIVFQDGNVLAPGKETVFALPVSLSVGETLIQIQGDEEQKIDQNSLSEISQPVHGGTLIGAAEQMNNLLGLGDAPAPETLTHWLETVIGLERLGADLQEFYTQTARALVELIGLDLGLVILRREDNWIVAASHVVDDSVSMRFSHTLVNLILEERKTYFQDLDQLATQAESLSSVEAIVASPIFGIHDEVAGILYGVRNRAVGARLGVSPLEAQVVQLLAAVVGANLARSTALRTRIQFEQFFSPELVVQLERDPKLLEGRNQEVTILCSDLRGFTAISERLGAATTCLLIRDLMEHLSEHIVDNGGVIVDYAGDGILAMWNAPVTQPDHAQRACRAALYMRSEMPALNLRWQDTVGEQLKIGIGLNTGVAQVGNTGSSRKFKYGPHGYTVNLASRVQAATKELDTVILLTQSTLDLVADSFHLRLAGSVPLAGVPGDTNLYELFRETESVSLNV